MRENERDGGDMPSPAPLTGIRVLEIGSYIAGPFCGMQLADLGADVIKIEVPDSGDLVRHTAPYLFPNGSKDVLGAPSADGQSSNFIRLNRNKRSLALDLKDSQGKEIFRKLAATADVVVENMRPGVSDRLRDRPGALVVVVVLFLFLVLIHGLYVGTGRGHARFG